MKTTSTIRYLLAGLTAALLIAASPEAGAQDENRGRGRGGAGGRAGFGFGIPDATDEQTAAMQEMNQGLQDQATKVREARTALAAVVHAEKVDEAAIKSKVADLAKAEEALALARAAAFAKIRSKFNADQIEAIKTQSAAGFGGFGRRGGGGGGRRGQQNN